MDWQPIETAPKDGKIPIMIAQFNDGELIDIDFDAIYEEESESWELPEKYWVWKSAYGRVEDPTHWAWLPQLSTPGAESNGLLEAAEALFAAHHPDHFAARMSDSEMEAIEALKVAIAKAREKELIQPKEN